MPHQNRHDGMSQDEQRKSYGFKTDKSDKFEVARVHQSDEHLKGSAYEVVCKALPNDNVLYSSQDEATSTAYCNLANEVMRSFKHSGPGALSEHDAEELKKAHERHGLDVQAILPELRTKVEGFYRRLMEMGNL